LSLEKIAQENQVKTSLQKPEQNLDEEMKKSFEMFVFKVDQKRFQGLVERQFDHFSF